MVQKKYKSRYDWAGKVIYWESCEREKKINNADKLYMCKPEK